MKAILTFHSIDNSGSVLSFPPECFRKLVQLLAESPIPILGLEDLLASATESGISITFDDGMASVLTHAVPVIKEYGLPAHLFVVTDHVGRDNRWSGQPSDAPSYELLDWSGIDQCQSAGMFIESHSASHADLRRLTVDEADEDCARADEAIARRTGREPRFFAYPYGYFSKTLGERLGRRYAACLTTKLRYLARNERRTELPRLDTYYVQDERLMLLWRPHVKAYLGLRGWLRTVRGTQ